MNITEHQTGITMTDKRGQLHELNVDYSYSWKTKDLIFVRLSNNIGKVEIGLFLPDEKARLRHELHQHAAICLDPKVLDKILS
jgi:CDP-diacylglycerol pyrophosphatase